MRRFLAVVALALSFTPAAYAKDGVEATLLGHVPSAPAGDVVAVRWYLGFDDESVRHPFNVSGAFVRLVPPAGEPTVGYAHAGAHEDGRYSARVAIPEGGVARVEFGIRGTSCDARGCMSAPALFPLSAQVVDLRRPPTGRDVVPLARAFLAGLF